MNPVIELSGLTKTYASGLVALQRSRVQALYYPSYKSTGYSRSLKPVLILYQSGRTGRQAVQVPVNLSEKGDTGSTLFLR